MFITLPVYILQCSPAPAPSLPPTGIVRMWLPHMSPERPAGAHAVMVSMFTVEVPPFSLMVVLASEGSPVQLVKSLQFTPSPPPFHVASAAIAVLALKVRVRSDNDVAASHRPGRAVDCFSMSVLFMVCLLVVWIGLERLDVGRREGAEERLKVEG